MELTDKNLLKTEAYIDGAWVAADSGEVQDANLVLELDAGLRAGYRGYYGCDA